MRIAYVLLFCVVFSFSEIVIAVIALIQSILSVTVGEPSETLKDFGARLGVYLKQISEFISFSSDEKPFPFADWPEPESKRDSTND
ncbi:hypothetical protein A3715_00745 [Oleiphilus sp. HI0009]|uniref:DUF4389 domain-containing protein n=1 Tax=unclassified Oleiphilus TaxID=2631174 RepID=UPI0007C34233|nr:MULTISPECIES: DUF4389 domain-containing protein [unclassified Oleiphilus]KZX78162.1 hypothetical protein A3715_20345 [Oleiphilus sp. HI0009]MCH2157200.1 DUF4389 domain-containing protein [Oleiphilaceae bacterium]KZX82314.1 hypothetical protein A3715_00745 [Oleiphilus sp. HI0009]KZY66665.1 hypothetical protein A3738_05725 [Oleiphilus sp. HI0066]KZY73138.1 hypothetical protein A3739_03135 [Oleiphilus sp. HI0067]